MGLLGLVGLAACETSSLAPRQTTVSPEARPDGLRPVAAAPVEPVVRRPSRASRELAAYYQRLQNDLLVRGLLRTDGGGPDTVFTDTMLARNFENIALSTEHDLASGFDARSSVAENIRKWITPVRITVDFSENVPEEQRGEDLRWVDAYAAKLGRVTGHPVSMANTDANFLVLFVATDDTATIPERIKQFVPEADLAALSVLRDLPRTVHCFVLAFATSRTGYDYGRAVAVVRSEHPDLMRRACIHEEIAQGFGLSNDNPRARPSIFNDDDEFALLTRHDELLLKILYDDALRPGMTADEARSIVRRKAAALLGTDLPG
ncbi:DUF2927 domain-containing protein [Cognatishimia sp. F0-27]|uniref:DUF2927 domain-containing protein n=1 Tax=Cognatishimia sp. F0-27 TaxID=2816855 RepID=UPI001D0C59D7|nr:DUF2927 domain-containing protein [Cognatishimia sp. F0-27]MCC1492014.1 DUF2927 domain-containing protein [Cognatishimia sp. F0-27]